MSEGLNRVFLAGNLADDAVLRFTQGGQPVLNMRVACNERFKDKDGEWKDRCEFISCVLWGKRGEALAKFLTKGSMVVIKGGLRNSSYEDKDGNKRYKTEVNVDKVLLAGKGGGAGGDNPRRSGPVSGKPAAGAKDDPAPEDDCPGDDLPF